MEIHPTSAFTAFSFIANSPQQRQPSTSAMAIFADKATISQAARDLLATQSNSAATSGNGTTAVFDTDQGSKNLNIDTYFTPGTGTSESASSLPPLLLPTQNNIDALTSHISATFPQFLSQNNIPSAPSSITYDSNGQIQLPSDYAYASQFKQALANNPMMSNELRTVHALTSDLTEMKKAIPFQQEYAAAITQAAADAVVAKYRYLFSGNRHYDTIALQFSTSGSLSLTDDGQPLS